MDKQAREAREQTKALSTKKKWENFWFYYKKHVFITIFVAVVVIVSVVQCSKRTDYDLNVSYYTSIGAPSESAEKLEIMLQNAAVDTNGNEKVDVGVALYSVDMTQMNEQAQAVNMKFMAELAAGTSMGYIFDETFKGYALHQYSELGDTILEISGIPEIREILSLKGEEKLYWFTKTLYDAEKKDKEKIAEHNNAIRVEKMLIKMGATVVEQPIAEEK